MNRHQIICGSLAWACAAGAILMVARAHPVVTPPDLFFAGLVFLLAVLFVWMGWWDDAVNGGAEPSWLERAVATGWLWMRRIVCWTAAAAFLAVAATLLADGIEVRQVPFFLAAVMLGVLLIWVGLKGTGRVRSLSDDAAVHAGRRKRYGWWF
jgi:hypothetical protein